MQKSNGLEGAELPGRALRLEAERHVENANVLGGRLELLG